MPNMFEDDENNPYLQYISQVAPGGDVDAKKLLTNYLLASAQAQKGLAGQEQAEGGIRQDEAKDILYSRLGDRLQDITRRAGSLMGRMPEGTPGMAKETEQSIGEQRDLRSKLREGLKAKLMGGQEKAMGELAGLESKEAQRAFDEKQSKEKMLASTSEAAKDRASRERAAALAAGAKPEKPATDAQFSAASYAARMQQAENEFQDLAGQKYDPTSRKRSFQSMLPGEMQPAELQRQEQAEKNFLTAVLRKESGAAISAAELNSGGQMYFPRPGDSPAVAAQKARNRQLAMSTMKQASGPAWAQVEPTIQQFSPVDPYKNEGTAQAAPAGKPESEMSEAELDAEIQRLKGGK